MLHFREVIGRGTATPAPAGSATLTLDERRRSRLRLTLDDGREGALLLARGSALREGDRLRADDGTIVVVRAAAQALSLARTSDPHLLLRGAYHLGNRHVPVELGDGWLAYEHDHVLDDMVRGLGLVVETRRAPFEPEAGAFSHPGAHVHDHGHDRDQTDAHEHEHGHGHHGGSHRHA